LNSWLKHRNDVKSSNMLRKFCQILLRCQFFRCLRWLLLRRLRLLLLRWLCTRPLRCTSWFTLFSFNMLKVWRITIHDDRIFCSILGSIISSKLTKTGPNMKNNLQIRRKHQDKIKIQKIQEKPRKWRNCAFHRSTMVLIVPRWECLLAKEEIRVFFKQIYISCYDGLTWRPSWWNTHD
jgi:hypothetical protein